MEVLSHKNSMVLRNMDTGGVGEVPLIPRPLLPIRGEGELEHKTDLVARMRRKCQRILLGKH
jgi:hypothetical protein